MDAIEARFRALCKPSTASELQRLIPRVETHAEAVVERHLSDPNAQAAIAEQLAAQLVTLVKKAAKMDDATRATIRGAIEYFLLTSDVDNDMSEHGMEDDRYVLALVTRELAK